MPAAAPSSVLPSPAAPHRRPGGRSARRSAAVTLLLLVAALFCSLLAGASTASAHAALITSDPRQGAVVDTAPEEVTLTFSEGVALSDDAIRVLDPEGKRVDTGEVRDLSSGTVVKYGVGVESGVSDGTFTVAWKVVSADSHPVAGAFTFSVGAPSKTSVALPQEQGGGVVGILYGTARYAAYAGFVLLAGGAAFVLACRPRAAAERPVQRLVVRGWALLTGSTIVLLLLRGPYTGSGRLADIADLGVLRAVLESKPGAALASRLMLLGVAALFVAVLFGSYAQRTNAKERKDLAFGLAIGGAVVATGTAATWAMSEHASTGIQSGLAIPVDIVHLLAVAAWLGGLAALFVTLRTEPSVERSAVRRFSRLAFGSVLVLAATGVYQSWRQVGSWSALTSTSYGRTLLIKIGLVVVLVGVAAISRRWTSRLPEAAAERDGEATDPGGEGSGDSADDSGGADRAEASGTGDDSADRDSGGGGGRSGGSDGERDGGQAGGSDGERVGAGGREPVPVPADPHRTAQLERQRAARAAALRKRARDADPERSGLRRSVLIEAAVAVVLLAVTTALTSTEPARTEEAVRAASGAESARPAGPVSLRMPFDTGGEDGKGTAEIEVDRANALLDVRLKRPNGRPLDAPEVKVAFTLASKKLGPLPVLPPRAETGHWAARGVQIPMPGTWEIALTVRTTDIDQVTVTKELKIG
ncbi:copper resistance protein CopC [Streptomyces sp. NPDC051776]|uniref:copper resistance CopC/CopD family protein n=1 Tax=Streptomyces sp. NPDC051776 TaxID=3155414 RepID=UPI003438F656